MKALLNYIFNYKKITSTKPLYTVTLSNGLKIDHFANKQVIPRV